MRSKYGISPDNRAKISLMIVRAMERKNWTIPETAEKATLALYKHADTDGLTSRERELYRTTEIDPKHIEFLRKMPARPFADEHARARMLGVTLALGLDRAEVNRLCGGI